MDDLLTQVRSEKAEEASNMMALTKENVKAIWNAYLNQTESLGVKTALMNVELAVEENKVKVYVPNSVSKDYILQEDQLIKDIREKTKRRDLSLNIVIEASRFPDFTTQTVKKVLGPKEKQKLMVEKNPKIQELINKFALRPEK